MEIVKKILKLPMNPVKADGKKITVGKMGENNQEVPVGMYSPIDDPKAYKPKEGSVYYHIDAPVRRLVAHLNLLGCETAWSCCGHNYLRLQGNEANVPKDHTDHFQIYMKATAKAFDVCKHISTDEPLVLMGMFIQLRTNPTGEPMIIIESRPFANRGQMWGTPGSPHFHEFPNLFKTAIIRSLKMYKGEMLDEVDIKDYNAEAVKNDPHWQYRPSQDWHVKKKDLIKIP